MQIRILGAAWVVAVVACSPKPADTQGADESSGAGETAGSMSAPTSTDGGTLGMGESSATEVSTSESPGDPTVMTNAESAEPPPDSLDEACAAICDRLVDCEITEESEACVPGCVGEADEDPVCGEAMAAQWSCVAALECEQIGQFMEDATQACAEEAAGVDQACSGIECAMISGEGDAEFCTIGQVCGDLTETFECESDTCTCVVNDVPGATCPGPGHCSMDQDARIDAAEMCCGFDW